MIKKKKRILVIIWLIASFNSCVMDSWYPLYVTNNTNHSISFSFFSSNGVYYPDTLLKNIDYIFKNIIPESRFSYDSGLSWDKIFSSYPNDTMSFFIFHPDTLKKYSWYQICDKYMILKRYDLSLADLKRLDMNISYPPDERMKDMKMYPPYGQ